MHHRLSSIQLEKLLFGNIRTEFGDIDDLRRLGESLKIGQIHPIVVRSDNLLIDGERRVRAARMVGITELLAIVTDDDLTPDQIREFQFVSTVHRADLSSWDKCQAMHAIKAAHPDWSHRQLAELVCLDPSMVTRLLSPFQCIPAVQDALKAGAIGIKAVYEISKEVDEARQALLLAEALQAGADGVARQRRKLHSSAVTTARLSRIKYALPSGVQITASGESISLDEFIDALSDSLKAAKKAREDGLNAKTFSHVMRDRSRNGS